jgi:hypothetical protein
MAKVAYIGKTEWVDKETLEKLFPASDQKCFICDGYHDIETPCAVQIEKVEPLTDFPVYLERDAE